MQDRASIKKRVQELVALHAPKAIDLARDVLEHPETGFREFRTANMVREFFDYLGLPHQHELAITGVRADLIGGAPGPRVAVMGELDSLIVPGHPFAEPNTNFAHACGHHTQIGSMLAAAAALSDPDVRDALHGHVAFMAVPAEEYIELEYRQSLVQQGKLEFMGGKAELVKLGVFDDIDIAMLTHSSTNTTEGKLAYGSINNGAIAKEARFIGVQAHAGSAPHKGINALQAATLAIAAINANRETFQDPDSIRVHPIITHGGDVVNAVPANVRMEMFVRGRSLEAIADADAKVERALKAGALAVGAKVALSTYAAYLPMTLNEELVEVFRRNAEIVVGKDDVRRAGPRGSSSDMGDLSHLLPTIQPYATGCIGAVHGSDFVVNDYEAAVTNPAAAMALTVIDLLADGGEARHVIDSFRAPLTKGAYLALQRGFNRQELYDGAAG
jgi:amidohydrolase